MRRESVAVALSLKLPTHAVAETAGIAVYETVYRLSLLCPSTQKPQPARLGRREERFIIAYPQPVPHGSQGIAHISISDACEEFGVNEQMLIDLCSKGEIEAKKVKGKWLVSRDSLENWLTQQAQVGC